MKEGFVILPIPLPLSSLRRGSVENLTLGTKRYRVAIPPGVRVGQRIRLRGIAHQIDPRLQGQDIHLLVQPYGSSIYQVRRDIQLELPLNSNRIYYGGIERITVGEKRFDVKVPPGLRPGKRLRLRRAAERFNGGYEGDIYLHIVPNNQPSWRLWGLFADWDSFSERRLSMKFKLPWFFEIGGEWILRVPESQLSIDKWKQPKEIEKW